LGGIGTSRNNEACGDHRRLLPARSTLVRYGRRFPRETIAWGPRDPSMARPPLWSGGRLGSRRSLRRRADDRRAGDIVGPAAEGGASGPWHRAPEFQSGGEIESPDYPACRVNEQCPRFAPPDYPACRVNEQCPRFAPRENEQFPRSAPTSPFCPKVRRGGLIPHPVAGSLMEESG
jgi:hypothetical protein